MPAQMFKLDEIITVFIEQEGGTHIYSGKFVEMDETGVMIRYRLGGVLQFFPHERIVMIEKKEV